MPIGMRWVKLTHEAVRRLPAAPGVYEIGYSTARGKKLWYPGRTTNLHRRLGEHLRNPNLPKRPLFRYHIAGPFEDLKELESKLFDDHERKHAPRPAGTKARPRPKRLW